MEVFSLPTALLQGHLDMRPVADALEDCLLVCMVASRQFESDAAHWLLVGDAVRQPLDGHAAGRTLERKAASQPLLGDAEDREQIHKFADEVALAPRRGVLAVATGRGAVVVKMLRAVLEFQGRVTIYWGILGMVR